MKQYIYFLFFIFSSFCSSIEGSSFFQATTIQPYHLSVGAILFNHEGKIACHHFSNVLGHKDIYILMRESMENDETILMTLERGLREEFGATATPVAFLGSLAGELREPRLCFEKTTLYILCQLQHWDPSTRDTNDPEAISTIEWLPPEQLIALMEEQGRKFQRVDADESEIIKRALPYLQKFTSRD